MAGLPVLSAGPKPLSVTRKTAASASSFVEISGVGAGPFNPRFWQAGTLNWVPDLHSPLLEPREGPARNIYAPSAVETRDGWRLFYGAWDGVPTMNDRVYSAETRDFLTFANRHTVIEHGRFTHVCNVNALRLADGSYSMVATVYPDERGRNKPAFFRSPDGKTWNGSPEPYVAQSDDMVKIEGYPAYADADINGMNVLLREAGAYRLYFGDFKDLTGVFRASGTDGKSYRLDGKVLEGQYAVNDVKRLRTGTEDWYLMGLHMNGDRLWYSLSRDGLKFPAPQTLFTSRSPAERYIVALGWVVRGEPEQPGTRVLGVLYGAGADSHLASNRIFARWLQKKVVFVGEDGSRTEGEAALGPERQLLSLGKLAHVRGRLELYAENGKTLLGTSPSLTLKAGEAFAIKQ
jgi:hypothetical protein